MIDHMRGITKAEMNKEICVIGKAKRPFVVGGDHS